MKYIALILIKLYQLLISFYPSCSVYTYQAIRKFGFIKGTFLGSKRLLKCHPFHSGGVDPVP